MKTMEREKVMIKQKIKKKVVKMAKRNIILARINNYRKINYYSSAIATKDQLSEIEQKKITKEEFVEKCKKSNPRRASYIDKVLSIGLSKVSDELINKISTHDLYIDILFCCFAYGFDPDEYFAYRFVDRNKYDRQLFISESESKSYVYRMNDSAAIDIYNDKGQTYEKFHKFYGRKALIIDNFRQFDSFIAFISQRRYIVKKIVTESLGNSIELIDLCQWRNMERELFTYFLKQGKVILEDLVHQSAKMATFNNTSVNTIRIITFFTRNGVVAPYCFVKTGRNGSFVDNGGAGGILAGVDIKNGMINTDGFDETGKNYAVHPDTQTTFKGFEIPDFTKAIELAKRLSSMTPKVKYIGWDFAHTDNGWVIIEGNGMSQLIGPQTTMQKGIKKDVLEIMSNMDLIC